MAESYHRPDLQALAEVEELLRHLGDELAGWRRRSLKAETDLQQIRANGGTAAGPELAQARQRIIELERENQALHQRVEAAKERVKALATRLSFLEQGEPRS